MVYPLITGSQRVRLFILIIRMECTNENSDSLVQSTSFYSLIVVIVVTVIVIITVTVEHYEGTDSRCFYRTWEEN